MTQRPETRHAALALIVAGLAAACSTAADGPTERAAGRPASAGESSPLLSPPPARTEGTALTPERAPAGDAAPPMTVDKPAPRAPVVTLGEGETLLAKRRYEEAALLFANYTAQQPDDPWGHYLLGLSRWKLGAAPEAEAAFVTALAIDPVHVKSLVNLARVLIASDRVDEAHQRLRVARDYDPASAEVFRLLGRVHHARGEIDHAIDAYHHAVRLDDEDAWSMNNLGLLLLEQGRPADAVPPLARAVELREDLPVFHNNLGLALEHSGRFVAAAEAYDLALVVDPTHEKAVVNYGRVEMIEPDLTLEPFDRAVEAARFAESLREGEDLVGQTAENEEEEEEE